MIGNILAFNLPIIKERKRMKQRTFSCLILTSFDAVNLFYLGLKHFTNSLSSNIILTLTLPMLH